MGFADRGGEFRRRRAAAAAHAGAALVVGCLLFTSPRPRDRQKWGVGGWGCEKKRGGGGRRRRLRGGGGWVVAANPPPAPAPPAIADDAQDTNDISVTLPGPGETVRFEPHIRPLFRPMDRNSMLFAFDLWNEADVTRHAPQILARLEAGTMPCDGAWPAERIALFARWAEAIAPR